MAFDAFLIFESPGDGAPKVEGETQDDLYKQQKAFEIDSFEFGVTNTINIGSKSGGAGAGKAEFKEFQVTKTTDNGSPGLFHCCCCGGHYKRVQLILRRSGGTDKASGKEFLVYTFHLVAVKDIGWSGSSGDDVPQETVLFEYGAIEINYKPQKASGGQGEPNIKKWSRVKNNDTVDVGL